LRDIAGWCFENGKWRLTPIFADRAADLARRGGIPLRRVWCQIESRAVFYQNALGHSVQALDRIGHLLTQAREFSTSPRDSQICEAQTVRAQVLNSLGRNDDALAEIEAFAPIQAEVLGARHPNTLVTRCLRAQVLNGLGRNDDALAEIEAFAPIQVEVLGARHPDALATLYLRALVLNRLGRDDDALAEIEAFAAIQAEVLGVRHPSTLASRSLYCKLTSAVQKS